MKSTAPAEDPALEELERVLGSPEFSRSERLARFLRFVVQQKVQGKAGQLKETVIGVEVFGRKPDYDPRSDPVVRIEAAKLRARLAEYYNGSGAKDSIRIEIPKGAYIPSWQAGRPVRPSPTRKRIAAMLSLLALVVAGVAVWQWSKTAPKTAIAVLPFVNISSDPENEYFSDGLTEEIIHLLSSVSGLEVTSGTSSFSFKGASLDSREIANRLNVTLLLEGSVRKVGDQLRVTAQLIRAADGKDLWSNAYDRRMPDVFAIQQEIAGSIAAALRLKLGAGQRRYTDNLEAYQSYFRGRYALQTRSARQALQHFEKAIANDGQFALAYAGLADALLDDGMLDVEGHHERAKAAAEKAVQLDPTLSEGQSALATVMAHEYKWREAEPIFRKAIELNPNNSVAHTEFGVSLLIPLERFSDGLAELRRAEDLDPLAPNASRWLAFVLVSARRYDEAIVEARKSAALQNRPEPYLFWGRALYMQGKTNEALDKMRQGSQYGAPGSSGWLACASVRAGLREQALRILQDNIDGVYVRTRSRRFAQIYGCLGDADTTFAYLEKMYAERDALLPHYLLYPELDFMRSDPRFAALQRKMNLRP